MPSYYFLWHIGLLNRAALENSAEYSTDDPSSDKAMSHIDRDFESSVDIFEYSSIEK